MDDKKWASVLSARVVGENVKRLRRSASPKSISTRALAEISGLSRPTITKLEAAEDEDGVTMSTVARLADALGVHPIELILPEQTSHAMEPFVVEFQASDVAKGLGVTHDEIMWLRSFPTIAWGGARPDAAAIAELVLWKRRNTEHP